MLDTNGPYWPKLEQSGWEAKLIWFWFLTIIQPSSSFLLDFLSIFFAFLTCFFLSEWNKNSSNLLVTSMPKLKPQDCFHYPIQDMDRLYALNGYSSHETMSFIPNLNMWKDISGTNILSNTDSYASFTRIRNYIWVAGGLGTTCSPLADWPGHQISIKGSHQSFLWRMGKKRWIPGPVLKKSYRYVQGKIVHKCSFLQPNI